MAETDPDSLVSRWARFDAAIGARLADLYPVLLVAADGDPDVAALNQESERNRHGGAGGWSTSSRTSAACVPA